MPAIDPRNEQMFPKFASAEVDRLRRFGEVRRHTAGEPLFKTGDVAQGMFVLITGSVTVSRHDPLGRLAPIVELGPGDFVAEVGQLSGRRSSMFMPLTMWRRCSFRPGTCEP
jgi:thioredoxin reductase (NADPH)